MDISEFKYLLWDNTRKINDATNTALSSCGSRYGLTAMQLMILMEIHQNGTHTVGTLANSVVIAGANISTMCKKLESMDLLTRIRDRQDERVVKIELTEKGNQIIEEINRYFEKKIMAAMGDDLSDNLEAIIIAMEKLNALLIQLNR